MMKTISVIHFADSLMLSKSAPESFKPVLANFLLVLVLLMMLPLAFAEEDKQYLLSQTVYETILGAQELVEADKYNEAETALNLLLTDNDDLDSYEIAVAQQTLGFLYSAQERYKKAARYFRQALSSGALPPDVSHNLTYNLAQLLIIDEQYKVGIVLLKKWLAADSDPPSSAYVLLASTYYQLQDYANTIIYIKAAIDNDDAKESWHQLLLSSYLETQQYLLAIKVLENLIESYPYNKTYWDQLSALYFQQDDEFVALAVKMLVTRLELNDEKTLMNLSTMYQYLQIPYKSALILAKGIKDGVIPADLDNLTRLADSWLAARENKKAAQVLKQAAILDSSGKADLKYGRVLFDLSLWQQAIPPLSAAIKESTGKRVGRASLLLGMTYFYLDDLSAAKRHFNRALKFKSERKQAGQWLRYVKKKT